MNQSTNPIVSTGSYNSALPTPNQMQNQNQQNQNQQNQNQQPQPQTQQYQQYQQASSFQAQNRPQNISDLNNKCSSPEGRQSFLDQNLAFYATIMTAVAVKNKLDYPPAGPVSPGNLQFQNEKLVKMFNSINSLIQNPLFMSSSIFYSTIISAIMTKNQLDFPRGMSQQDQQFQGAKLKCLFDAIVEKTTSSTNASVQYPLAQHGAIQQGVLNTRAGSSKMMGMGRGVFGRGGWFGNGGKYSRRIRRTNRRNTRRR